MPVLPNTYIPSTPGQFTQNVLDARDQQASFMERKQRLAMAQEQHAQQTLEFIAKLPAIRAQEEAHAANARAAIKLSADMDMLEAKAAQAWEEPNGYNERFQNILQGIPDPSEQAAALQVLQGEVAWTKQFKAYAPGVDAVNNARASAFTLATTNYKLDQHLEEEKIKADARKTEAVRKAQTSIEVANIRANAPGAAQKLIDAYEEARNSGADEETIAALKGAIDKETTRSVQRSIVERAIANRDAALAAGNRAKAQVFQDEINKATSFASDPIKNPLPELAPAAPTSPTTGWGPVKEIKLPSGGGVLKLREKTAK